MGNLWVTIPLMKIICCWFLTYFGKGDGRWHLVHFPTCLLALDYSCWELQILWMIWKLVLGRYSQGKVSSETAWSEGLSQSWWAVGKNNQASKSETWRFETPSRIDNGCPKRGNPPNHHLSHSEMMFRQGCSYCGGTRRKAKRNGSQKEKMHCSDTKRPRLKKIHRNELAKILRVEKEAFGLREDVRIHPWEKSRWTPAERRLQGAEAWAGCGIASSNCKSSWEIWEGFAPGPL